MKTTRFTEVDKRNKKEMIDFLSNHFRYNTMNSWNRSTSYANNVKIYSVIPNELQDKVFELLDVEYFYEDNINWILSDWEAENPGYSAGFNGRSGGYIVLYNEGYPGRSIDQGEDFENWEVEDLRQRVTLVQSFDKMCDTVVEQIISLASNCTIEEEEYTITKKRKVITC